MDDDRFGFGGKKPVPCSDRALKLGAAVLGIVRAQESLERAYDRVPDYTAQWSSEDYYAEEQENFYRACERYENILDGAIYEVGDFVLFSPFSTEQHVGVAQYRPFDGGTSAIPGFGTIKKVGDRASYGVFEIELLDPRGRDSGKTVTVNQHAVIRLSNRTEAMKQFVSA